MKFQKGKPKTGGRLPGQPNKVTLDIKEHARAVIEDPDYQEKLKARLLKGRSPQLEVLLHYYAYGKPKLEVALVDSGLTVIVQRQTEPVPDAQPALPDHSIDLLTPLKISHEAAKKRRENRDQMETKPPMPALRS